MPSIIPPKCFPILVKIRSAKAINNANNSNLQILYVDSAAHRQKALDNNKQETKKSHRTARACEGSVISPKSGTSESLATAWVAVYRLKII